MTQVSTPIPGRPDRRRVRPRTVLGIALAAWAVLEIWLLVLVGGVLGGSAVVLLLLAGAVLGVYVLKQAGRRALRSAADAAGRGGPDHRAEPGDRAERPRGESRTAVTAAGGLLLVMPGLLTDLLGLACLFPPTRGLLHRVGAALGRAVARRLEQGDDPLAAALRLRGWARTHRPDGRTVPGEVVHPTAGAGAADPERPRGAGPGPGVLPPRRPGA